MGKSVAKNSLYNIIYKGFTAFFPLITTTYISRVLLADGVGKVSYANTIVTYFVMIAALGIPNYGVKAIAQCNNNKSDRSSTVFELFAINSVSTTICIIAYYIVVNIFPYFSYRAEIFNVFGFLLILNYFNFDWFYQGVEEYSYIATRSIVIKIICFVLMFLFVRTSDDYIKYSWILCVATAGNYILNTINLRKYVSRDHSALNIKRHIRPVLVLLASAVAQEVYTMLDTTMLEYFHGTISVGYYSNSVKIIRMVYTLTIAMVGAFYPRISQYIKEGKEKERDELITKGAQIILLVSIPAVIGLFLTAGYLVPVFFGDTFLPAIPTIKILSILILVFSVAYFLGHIILMACGQEKYILRATIAGAISNFILNYFLIPILKQNGAAIASVCAEIIVTIVLLIYSSKNYKLGISFNYYISLFSSSIVMGVCVYILSVFVSGIIPGLVISVVGGVFVYIGMLLLTKNSVVFEFLRIIQNKKRRQEK